MAFKGHPNHLATHEKILVVVSDIRKACEKNDEEKDHLTTAIDYMLETFQLTVFSTSEAEISGNLFYYNGKDV